MPVISEWYGCLDRGNQPNELWACCINVLPDQTAQFITQSGVTRLGLKFDIMLFSDAAKADRHAKYMIKGKKDKGYIPVRNQLLSSFGFIAFPGALGQLPQGANNKSPAAQPSLAERICPTCFTANPVLEEFCLGCGMSLLGANPPKLPPLKPTPAPKLLHGRYLMRHELGRGGFGAVYNATDTQAFDRPVAIKQVLLDTLSAKDAQEATAALQQEAKFLAGLFYPNLPRVYEYFREGSSWYMVMDYIEGETLEARLDREGALAYPDVVAWGLRLCDALEYLHHRKPPIIFRDLKPGNIMLHGDTPYLIDFGIARSFKAGQAKDTTAFGSNGYAAPEQYGKRQSTEQTDVYGLGATLYHALTGDDPSNHPMHFEPFDASLGVPAALAQLIGQMVSIRMEDRPASMALVRSLLEDSLRVPAPQPILMKMPSLVKKQPGAKQLLVLSAPFLATDPSVYPMDQFYIHELTKGLNAAYPDVLVVSETAFGGMSWLGGVMQSSDIILVAVSPDLLAVSPALVDKVVGMALDNSYYDNKIVAPLLLCRCDWKRRFLYLAGLASVPSSKYMGDGDLSKMVDTVVQGLAKIL